MFTIKGCSLIRGVHYERFHCTGETGTIFTVNDKIGMTLMMR